MLGWACDLLDPLVAASHPAAVWLQSDAKSQFSDVEIDPDLARQERLSALMIAADSGVAEAQFFTSLHFFDEGDRARSYELCAKADAVGHAHAMWCHGLDLISGNGGERNETKGLKMIEQAATQKFEGAIRFMADALALGQHGLDVDKTKAAEWHRLLSADDVIRY
jgi:TPR repeat protein